MASPLSRRVLHQRVLSILPIILRHARVVFGHLRCWHTREDRIAEVRALAWKWFVNLARKGKDAREFPTTLASYAAKAVKCGRRLCGQLKAKDVLSELAQQRRGFTIKSLPTSMATGRDHLYGDIGGQQRQDEFEERLHDNTVTPPDEQAAFRIDFRAWMKTLTPRERRIVKAMARNERTKDLSKEFEVSEGRISQMRREFLTDWTRFTDA